MTRECDVVKELRALRVSVDDEYVSEVERICERGAKEIERLRAGLFEIIKMGEGPFNRQSVRAREILIGDPTRKITESSDPISACAHQLMSLCVALAESHRLLNNSSGVCEVMRYAGITLSLAREAGVDEFDLRELRRAGVPD